MKKISFIVLLLTVSLISIPALAQTKMTQESDDSYGYEFEDDPLATGWFSPNDAILKIRGKGFRTMLIRPRTSFIKEMIRDIEEL